MLIPISDASAGLGVEIGIFGGSGFYEFLDDAVEIAVTTPDGAAAAPIAVGTIDGRRVAFLPRHGRGHRFAAHRVPFRANVWALASLGVRSIVGPCSVGFPATRSPSRRLRRRRPARRSYRGRPDTFHDIGAPPGAPGSDGSVHHQSFADPYDAGLRGTLLQAAARSG